MATRLNWGLDLWPWPAPARKAVTLISFTDDIYCIGPRRITTQLKRNGIPVNLVFLRPTDFWGQTRQRFQAHYYNDDLSEDLYQQLLAICKDSAVIGFSGVDASGGTGHRW